jgi:hypothetical protein
MSFVNWNFENNTTETSNYKTFIWSVLQQYLQTPLTFDNNFVFTFCTSVFKLDSLNLFLHGEGG